MNQLFVVNDCQPRLCGINASLIHSRHSRDNLFSHLRGKIIEITRRATKHGQIKRLLLPQPPMAMFEVSFEPQALKCSRESVCRCSRFPSCFSFRALLQLVECFTCFLVKGFSGIISRCSSGWINKFIYCNRRVVCRFFYAEKNREDFPMLLLLLSQSGVSQCCSRHEHNGFPLELYFSISCQSRKVQYVCSFEVKVKALMYRWLCWDFVRKFKTLACVAEIMNIPMILISLRMLSSAGALWEKRKGGNRKLIISWILIDGY